eukprot:11449146-Karenia_brevis.AAC.1
MAGSSVPWEKRGGNTPTPHFTGQGRVAPKELKPPNLGPRSKDLQHMKRPNGRCSATMPKGSRPDG